MRSSNVITLSATTIFAFSAVAMACVRFVFEGTPQTELSEVRCIHDSQGVLVDDRCPSNRGRYTWKVRGDTEVTYRIDTVVWVPAADEKCEDCPPDEEVVVELGEKCINEVADLSTLERIECIPKDSPQM
jgi:hypothetical protein